MCATSHSQNVIIKGIEGQTRKLQNPLFLLVLISGLFIEFSDMIWFNELIHICTFSVMADSTVFHVMSDILGY